jgi:hypothetical protein
MAGSVRFEVAEFSLEHDSVEAFFQAEFDGVAQL